MTTTHQSLIDNACIELRKVTERMRQGKCEAIALSVRMLALTLFEIKKCKPTAKPRKMARRCFHRLSSIRDELARKPSLAEADALQPAVECIEELIDMARELMG